MVVQRRFQEGHHDTWKPNVRPDTRHCSPRTRRSLRHPHVDAPWPHTGRCSTQRRPAGAGQGSVRADPDRTAAVARQSVDCGKDRTREDALLRAAPVRQLVPQLQLVPQHGDRGRGPSADLHRSWLAPGRAQRADGAQFGVQLRPVLGRARQGPDGAGPRSRPGGGRDEQQACRCRGHPERHPGLWPALRRSVPG